MFYRVVILNNNIETKDCGIFEDKGEACKYVAIHELELDTKNEQFAILDYIPKSLGNVPNAVWVKLSSFVDPKDNEKNKDFFDTEARQWDIEEVSTDSSVSVKLKDGIKRLIGNNMVVYRLEDRLNASLDCISVILPYPTRNLLNNNSDSWSKQQDILEIAKKYATILCKKKPESNYLIMPINLQNMQDDAENDTL